MKRSMLFVLFMSVIRFSISAYDYQTVYSHRVALYENPDEVIKCLRIDSTKFNGDSILHPLKNIQGLSPDCYTPLGASWLGDKIIVNSHWNYFFNQNNDTIRIKTDGALNDRWTVYSNNEMSVFGQILKVEEVPFLGITDSVKTIGFSIVVLTSSAAPSKAGTNNPVVFDGKTIQISKHYGLLKTFNFLIFPKPNDYTNTYADLWEQYSLSGLTNPTVGIQNLTWFGVYDFQAGDEIHTSHKTWDFYIYTPNAYTEEKTILKYISRKDYADSIVYQVEKTVGRNYGEIPVTHEMTRQVIYKDTNFDKLPSEIVVSGNSAFAYSMKIDSFTVKIRPSFDSDIVKYDTNCWRPPIADGCFPNFLYYKELGGPYYNCIGLAGTGEENKLVYYKKGTVSKGTPLVIAGLKELDTNPAFVIYPNPVHDNISINAAILTEPCMFELMDVHGNVLLQTEVSANNNSVSLSGFTNGLYLYRLLFNGKMVKAGKIVKM